MECNGGDGGREDGEKRGSNGGDGQWGGRERQAGWQAAVGRQAESGSPALVSQAGSKQAAGFHCLHCASQPWRSCDAFIRSENHAGDAAAPAAALISIASQSPHLRRTSSITPPQLTSLTFTFRAFLRGLACRRAPSPPTVPMGFSAPHLLHR